jgi:hypothetical protein
MLAQPSHWAQPLVNSSTHTCAGAHQVEYLCLQTVCCALGFGRHIYLIVIMCYIYVRLRPALGKGKAGQLHCASLPGRRFGNLSAESAGDCTLLCSCHRWFSISQYFPGALPHCCCLPCCSAMRSLSHNQATAVRCSWADFTHNGVSWDAPYSSDFSGNTEVGTYRAKWGAWVFTYNDSDTYVVELGHPVLIACCVAADRLRSPKMFCALRTTLATVLQSAQSELAQGHTMCRFASSAYDCLFIAAASGRSI